MLSSVGTFYSKVRAEEESRKATGGKQTAFRSTASVQ